MSENKPPTYWVCEISGAPDNICLLQFDEKAAARAKVEEGDYVGCDVCRTIVRLFGDEEDIDDDDNVGNVEKRKGEDAFERVVDALIRDHKGCEPSRDFKVVRYAPIECQECGTVYVGVCDDEEGADCPRCRGD